MTTDFCKQYLQAQGVYISPAPRVISKPITDRVVEFVPIVPEYERSG